MVLWGKQASDQGGSTGKKGVIPSWGEPGKTSWRRVHLHWVLKNEKGFSSGNRRESTHGRKTGGHTAVPGAWLPGFSKRAFSPPTSSLFPTFPLLRAQSTCCRD